MKNHTPQWRWGSNRLNGKSAKMIYDVALTASLVHPQNEHSHTEKTILPNKCVYGLCAWMRFWMCVDGVQSIALFRLSRSLRRAQFKDCYNLQPLSTCHVVIYGTWFRFANSLKKAAQLRWWEDVCFYFGMFAHKESERRREQCVQFRLVCKSWLSAGNTTL